MTTIKSVYSKLAEYTRTLEISDHAGGKNLVVHAGQTKLGVTVPTAELAAALGLVTREELDRKQAAWENECGNLEMTQRERDALRADLREADRARDAAADSRDEWKGRAEEAEATIARVKAAIEQSSTVDCAEIWIALDPKPAFVLPTEVPARIEARRDGKTYTFYLWTNGAGGSNDLIWVDEDDWTHSPSPERLMANFTDHRLIGAES